MTDDSDHHRIIIIKHEKILNQVADRPMDILLIVGSSARDIALSVPKLDGYVLLTLLLTACLFLFLNIGGGGKKGIASDSSSAVEEDEMLPEDLDPGSGAEGGGGGGEGVDGSGGAVVVAGEREMVASLSLKERGALAKLLRCVDRRAIQQHLCKNI